MKYTANHPEVNNASLVLDVNSSFYRICPNPDCSKGHMVSNRGRNYCSKACSDKHYNLLRKVKKESSNSIVLRNATSESLITIVQKTDLELRFERNLFILDSLKIDHSEIIISYESLLEHGFDKDCFTNRFHFVENGIKYPNTFWVEYGNYFILEKETEKLLIRKKI